MATDPASKHTSRTKPSLSVDKEMEKALTKNFRTPLPLLETLLIDNVYKQHYSLATNEYLRNHWLVYKETKALSVHEPFKFYDKRDVHFYLGDCRYIPSQSVHTKTDFGNKLAAGPGVDSKGQVPIPEDMQVRKFYIVPRKYPKRYPKDAKVDRKAK